MANKYQALIEQHYRTQLPKSYEMLKRTGRAELFFYSQAADLLEQIHQSVEQTVRQISPTLDPQSFLQHYQMNTTALAEAESEWIPRFLPREESQLRDYQLDSNGAYL